MEGLCQNSRGFELGLLPIWVKKPVHFCKPAEGSCGKSFKIFPFTYKACKYISTISIQQPTTLILDADYSWQIGGLRVGSVVGKIIP